MRIGMVLDAVFPPDPRVENEAIELIKAGHIVFLFCLTYHNEPAQEIINGIQVKRYTSNKLEYKLSALAYTIPLYSMMMKKKIHHFLVANKIEAIHIHDIRIAEAGFLANKKIHLPTVLDLHENRPEIMKLYPQLQKSPGKQLISPKKWKSKEEEFVKTASKLIVVTDEAKNELLSSVLLEEGKIQVVQNTIRKAFYKEAIIQQNIIDRYKEKFILLYLGDTGLRRGLQTAITSVKTLSNKIENIKLIIVGKNTTDIILKRQVRELGIEQYVDFEGWKDVKLFPSYITSSDVCISPLHRNIHHDTTYANKLFQYMSFSKPLLVSNATAQKNIVEKINAGLVHKEKDSKDFANKTLKLYNDKTLCKKLGNNGKKFVETEFSWEETSKNLIKLYDNLIK